MNTRHIQTFLMASAAFFAMSLPVRVPSTAQRLAAAVSHTGRIASAGVGDGAAVQRLEEGGEWLPQRA